EFHRKVRMRGKLFLVQLAQRLTVCAETRPFYTDDDFVAVTGLFRVHRLGDADAGLLDFDLWSGLFDEHVWFLGRTRLARLSRHLLMQRALRFTGRAADASTSGRKPMN